MTSPRENPAGVTVLPRTAAVMPRELVLASAGSGKTFRISSRLIGLLAAGEQPDAILASTFTRKAAGEILDRVLVRLADAALDPNAARELARHASPAVEAGVAASPVVAPEAWLQVLEAVVRALHRVNIGTLDAFFIRVARSFAHELRLPPDWGIADEPTMRRLHSEALQELLSRSDTGMLVELLRMMNRGRTVRSVHDGLLGALEFLSRLHHELDPAVPDPWGEVARAAAVTGTDAVGDDGATAAPDPDLDAGPAARATLAEAIAAVDPPRTGTGAPRRHWANALARAAECVRAGDWETFLASGLPPKILDGAETFDRVPIPPDVEHLIDRGLAMARAALARQLAAEARAMGRFAGLFLEIFERRQRDAAAYRFEDVTRMLGGPDPLAERPDLFYRLDMRTRHLLLDEFQDTSMAQWEALSPIAEELLAGHAGERAAIIVADPKQSIYGWRGAEPALVRHVGERYALDRGMLATSWRSAQPVLDVVNRVFENITANTVFGDPASDPAAASDLTVVADWAESFESHVAAKEDLPGYVRVTVGPDDPGRGEDRPRLMRRAGELVAELHAASHRRTIGVLVRKNSGVARLIHELRRLGVRASEEGGVPLTDSPGVAAVLALLRLADHPGDGIARYHVARSPLGGVAGYTDHENGDGAFQLAYRTRGELLRDGYGRTLGRLVQALAPACAPRELRRLEQLVELAYRYDPRATLRPTDFVRIVETERVEDPSGEAVVRVMTVHQSKGLEFDAVVLPDLDQPLFRGGAEAALPFRAAPAGRYTAVYPAPPAPVRRLFPAIDAAAAQLRAARLRDALSGLYVAMTRARHGLYILIKPDGEKGPGTARTGARIVREALAPDRPAREGDAAFFEHGDPDWIQALDAADRPTAPVTGDEAPPALRFAPSDRRVRVLPRRSPSELEGGRRVDLAQRLRLDTSPARARGSVVHAWFQQIGWLHDGAPSDDALRETARLAAAELPAAEVGDLIVRFRQWLDQPAVQAVLRRDAYPADVRLERELPFVYREGEAVVQGFIDRLVLIPDEDGGITMAEVLDYKTDAVEGTAAVDERVAIYRPQMEAYRRAVAALYRLDADRVRARLVFVAAGEIRELDARGSKGY